MNQVVQWPIAEFRLYASVLYSLKYSIQARDFKDRSMVLDLMDVDLVKFLAFSCFAF